MRAGLRIVLVVGAVMLLAGCARFNVRSDWDASASFDNMQSFEWLEPPIFEGANPFADNSLMRKRVRLALENALAARGFRQVGAGQGADFIVTWAVTLEERLRVQDGIGVGVRGSYGYGYGSIYSGPSVRDYQESTLVIDFLDPATRELIWRGWGTGIVGTRDRDRGDRKMAAGVKAILATFPPRD